MPKRSYTHLQALYPVIKEMLATGKTQREIAQHFGLKDKYVVLKLANNLNQRLYDIKVEISQFDEFDELVEKTIISYNTKVEATQPKEKQVTDEEWYRMERIRKEKENKARQEQQFNEWYNECKSRKKQAEQERNTNAPKIDDDEIDNNPPKHKSYGR